MTGGKDRGLTRYIGRAARDSKQRYDNNDSKHPVVIGFVKLYTYRPIDAIEQSKARPRSFFSAAVFSIIRGYYPTPAVAEAWDRVIDGVCDCVSVRHLARSQEGARGCAPPPEIVFTAA